MLQPLLAKQTFARFSEQNIPLWLMIFAEGTRITPAKLARSQDLARQRGLSTGDQVLVHTSGHGVQSFRVTCVTDAYGYFFHPDERAYGIVDASLLRRYFCIDDGRTKTYAQVLERRPSAPAWRSYFPQRPAQQTPHPPVAARAI